MALREDAFIRWLVNLPKKAQAWVEKLGYSKSVIEMPNHKYINVICSTQAQAEHLVKLWNDGWMPGRRKEIKSND